MALQDKYARLVQYAQSAGVQALAVTEQNNVLYVSGTATGEVKDRLWAIYDELDPDMRSGDLVLNIEVVPGTESEVIYEVQSGDNLSKIATKFPGITWNQIFEANRDQLKDPDMIRPGQKLKIPK